MVSSPPISRVMKFASDRILSVTDRWSCESHVLPVSDEKKKERRSETRNHKSAEDGMSLIMPETRTGVCRKGWSETKDKPLISMSP